MVRTFKVGMKRLARDRRGQGMVEYALLVAGVRWSAWSGPP